MWKIYDDLINAIPEELTVKECLVGLHWTLVRSERGVGAAMTLKGGRAESELTGIVGMPLKKLASHVKSWNMVQASVGQAAINSAFNVYDNLAAITGMDARKLGSNDDNNAFRQFLPELKGKKVAVIGHFPHIDFLNDVCHLSILERNPQGSDYPDPACEYILPYQDFVFITGTAFTNKTMPRLLELSKNAKVVVVGPSVPITPILFKYGVDAIAGMIVRDEAVFWKCAQEGGKMNIFKQGGQMVCIRS